jgi:ADP-heptose:LPS heptosyltransferase
MRVAVIQADSVGDTVYGLLLPWFIKQVAPDTETVLVGRHYTQALVAQSPSVDHWKDLESLNDEADAVAFFRTCDAVLHRNSTPHLKRCARLAGVPIRTGKVKNWRDWHDLTHRHFFNGQHCGLHEAEISLRLLPPLSPVFERAGRPGLTELCRGVVDGVLRKDLATWGRHGIPTVDLVLHPYSNGHGRHWPIGGYLALYERARNHGMWAVFTGSKTEAVHFATEPGAHLVREEDRLLGKLDLRQFMVLIAQSGVVVGSSSGPVHLAAALDVPVVAIYPAYNNKRGPVRWGPLGRKVSVVAPERCCRWMCRADRVDGSCECLRRASPDQVWAEVLRWFAALERRA